MAYTVNRAVMSRTKQYPFRCAGCGFTDQFILTTVAEGTNVNRAGFTIMIDSLFGTGEEKAQLRARAAAEAELDRTHTMVSCPKCKRPRASKDSEKVRIVLSSWAVALVWLFIGFLAAMLVVFPLEAVLGPDTNVPLGLISNLLTFGIGSWGLWRHVKPQFENLETLDERASFWTINPERWNVGVGDGGVLARR